MVRQDLIPDGRGLTRFSEIDHALSQWSARYLESLEGVKDLEGKGVEAVPREVRTQLRIQGPGGLIRSGELEPVPETRQVGAGAEQEIPRPQVEDPIDTSLGRRLQVLPREVLAAGPFGAEGFSPSRSRGWARANAPHL